MTDTTKSKKLWIPYYLTPAMLLFIIGLIMSNFSDIKQIETKTFDSTAIKTRVQDHVKNVPYSEMEMRKIVDHVKDSAMHISEKEVVVMKERMHSMDSITTIFMAEQWQQGQRLKRIEYSINELKRNLP